MQRHSVIGETFGYLVCLLTVVIFFMSVAGIVNNAFRVANPTAGPRVIGGARMMGGPGRHSGDFFFRTRGGSQRSGQVMAPPEPFPPSGTPDITTMRAKFVGDARFDAVRRLVLAIVMLTLSIIVFRGAFEWLNPKQASGGGT